MVKKKKKSFKNQENLTGQGRGHLLLLAGYQPPKLVNFRGLPRELSSRMLIQGEGGVAQVVEYLPSKCETLSSTPNTIKKK
jgi:hypothetical protein